MIESRRARGFIIYHLTMRAARIDLPLSMKLLIKVRKFTVRPDVILLKYYFAISALSVAAAKPRRMDLALNGT